MGLTVVVNSQVRYADADPTHRPVLGAALAGVVGVLAEESPRDRVAGVDDVFAANTNRGRMVRKLYFK